MAVFVVLLAGAVSGQPPLYVVPTPDARARQLSSGKWIDTIAAEVPPLTNSRDRRLPMIMWHGVGFDRLSEPEIMILAQRGLCQHLQLSTAMIPAARALQASGMPVILMEGRTDNWPYSLAPNLDDWAHQFDVTYPQAWFGKEDAFEWHGACPHMTAGWPVMQAQTQKVLEAFRDAGVTVDAVWTDYEGDPYPWSHSFDQLKHCRRCRRELPAVLLNDKDAWRKDAWQRYLRLYDEYFANSVRQVFPQCIVTNWQVVFSTARHPVRYFVRDLYLPPLAPKHFTATNPIAYASDMVWRQRWRTGQELTRDSVDLFFLHEMLQQLSTDAINRSQGGAVSIRCIPWVARVCRIADDKHSPAPIMSREMYREALRHLWLRGSDGMQLFNPMSAGSQEYALTEVQDAVAVYDEMLAFRQLLEDGKVMNFEIPSDSQPGIVWSGLRSDDEAVVRVITLAADESAIEIELWPGRPKTLKATRQGRTIHLQR